VSGREELQRHGGYNVYLNASVCQREPNHAAYLAEIKGPVNGAHAVPLDARPSYGPMLLDGGHDRVSYEREARAPAQVTRRDGGQRQYVS